VKISAGWAILPPLVANSSGGGDNHFMSKDSLDGKSFTPTANSSAPFSAGSIVVVTLGNPRDKFWGMVLALAAEGLSITGIELASFEDLIVMVKDGEPFTPAVVFFPMHRIERIELDLSDGSLPSLAQRFSAKTGLDPAAVLGSRGAGGISEQSDAAQASPPASRAKDGA
jgi:hypothetical protein